MQVRFNHMELTVPIGMLKEERENLKAFYGDIFGFTGIEVPMVDLDVPDKFLLGTDMEFSQFLFLAEDKTPLQPESYDHMGFLVDKWHDVDETLEKVREFQKKDPRVKLMHEDSDFDAGPVLTHFYYFHYLLPIWFDVQYLDFKEGMKPQKVWTYGDRKEESKEELVLAKA